MFVEGEHWKKNKPAGRGRAGSCWIAELMECPFYFAVKEVSIWPARIFECSLCCAG